MNPCEIIVENNCIWATRELEKMADEANEPMAVGAMWPTMALGEQRILIWLFKHRNDVGVIIENAQKFVEAENYVGRWEALKPIGDLVAGSLDELLVEEPVDHAVRMNAEAAMALDGTLLRLIMENLPQILAAVLALVEALGGKKT